MSDLTKASDRVCNVMSDIIDFRDRVYEPSLVNVPPIRELEAYLAEYPATAGPVLNDQGREGACTGFALAAVAHYLLRTRENPDAEEVSPRMLYEMAKRYDEVPGDDYDGSSARAAMKGWQKHGVCSGRLWAYKAGETDKTLTQNRVEDALKRPLGAYYRVNHKDLVAMHCALTDVGILYATGMIHDGWDLRHVNGDTDQTDHGEIPFREGGFTTVGGHAFAIVGYNERGFWIQNSWGDSWGRKGFALLRYEDWLTNGMDVWVARLGVPVNRTRIQALEPVQPGLAISSEADLLRNVRPHIIRMGNDGRLLEKGSLGSPEGHIETIFSEDIPRITANWQQNQPIRILIYAHGGLTKEPDAVQRVAEYRKALIDAEVYPISFIWRTGFWDTLGNVLDDSKKGLHMAESIFSPLKDMLLERLDDTLERLTRPLGKLMWDEMKENARLASDDPKGGARLLVQSLGQFIQAQNKQNKRPVEIHLVGHSAGSILLGHMIPLLQAQGISPESCTLWAPACTMAHFDQFYLPALNHEDKNKRLKRLSLFTLTQQAELDDHCSNLYHKSLLYLVSNAFEDTPRKGGTQPNQGVPLLGMTNFIEQSARLKALLAQGEAHLIEGPNTFDSLPEMFCQTKSHGAFDNDTATVHATLVRILNPLRGGGGGGNGPGGSPTDRPPIGPRPAMSSGSLRFKPTSSTLQRRRRALTPSR